MNEAQSENSAPQVQRRRAVSGGEVILLVLVVIVGMGMWIWVEREFNEFFYHWEPNKERILASTGAHRAEIELAQLQGGLAETQKQLNDAKLDELKQQTTVAVLEQRHPDLLKGSTGPSLAATELAREYDGATTQLLISRSLVKALSEQMARAGQEVQTTRERLGALQDAADSEFHRQNARYIVFKPMVTLLITLAAAFLGLMFVKAVMRLIPRKKRDKREFSPVLLVVAVLLILFAYQAFQLAGAAIVSILLVLFVLFRINWPTSSQANSIRQ
ncbi:MAG TPA: hypothetical protein VFD63_04855 [Pyrinomonadaceae bacterium]|nr:hypothetical protein [Pyrinomonadaceae bacterium]